MEPATIALLVAAAFGAGAMNAVAGGGSFLSFPALVFAGVPPVAANATSATAVWPASIASALAFRKDLVHERRVLWLFGIVSLAGGLLGALLLILTPERRFSQLVPWLLLAATLIFAAGPSITKALRARELHAPVWLIAAVQFVIAIYGGYFGGGMGIMMLAAFSALGIGSMNAMNGLKHVLAVGLNGIAIVAFVWAGIVVWPYALLMTAGSIAGGWFVARWARGIDAKYVRWFVIAIGAVLTVYFFAQL